MPRRGVAADHFVAYTALPATGEPVSISAAKSTVPTARVALLFLCHDVSDWSRVAR